MNRVLRALAPRSASALKRLGSLALGALAVGALAVGAVAIGRLVIGRARIRRVEIDELVVGKASCCTRTEHARPFGDFPSRANDGLPRDFCAAGPTPDLRSRPPGAQPTIVVMHGFPDNSHLYDRLLPHLSPRAGRGT